MSGKFIPKLLTNNQKENQQEARSELKQMLVDDPEFLPKVVTSDETWVYSYDLETKSWWSQWQTAFSPWLENARMSLSHVKAMLAIIFDSEGLIHHNFIQYGQTVNKNMYKQVLGRVRYSLCRKRHNMWDSGDWFLHHDDAPAHTTITICQ